MIPSRTVCAFVFLSMSHVAFAQTVRIGVLGLFHSRDFIVSAPAGSALTVSVGQRSVLLDSSAGASTPLMHLADGSITVQAGPRTLRGESVHIASRRGGPIDFFLEVPGKITRRYRGILDFEPGSGSLQAIVSMDLETAVASVVAAESAPGAPLEALKAQAVVARSYFVAGAGRHDEFDFCDTTHCQFLRYPPAEGTLFARATAETRGMVLTYRSVTVAAMYTRSCGGRTRTPADVGLPAASYPYFKVECKYCREHPVRWQREVSREEVSDLRADNEADRLEIGRRLGWNTLPSSAFIATSRGEQMILEGRGQGHGIGLCQAGAKAMAQEGAMFSEILQHYYPNTTITSIDSIHAGTR